MCSELVAKWFEKVAPFANEDLYLKFSEDGKVSVVGDRDEVVTLQSDWNVMLQAPSLEELGKIMEADL